MSGGIVVHYILVPLQINDSHSIFIKHPTRFNIDNPNSTPIANTFSGRAVTIAVSGSSIQLYQQRQPQPPSYNS